MNKINYLFENEPYSILRDLKKLLEKDIYVENGKSFYYAHYANANISKLAKQAFELYFHSNAASLKAFPSIQILENDIINWLLKLHSTNALGDGIITSGGSEAILLAVYSAKCYASAQKKIPVIPNIVIPNTAHPAFDKAGLYFGIEVRRVQVNEEYQATKELLENFVDSSTILIAASAPCFPYGVIDSTEAIGLLAKQMNIWFHIDACVGGMIIPFINDPLLKLKIDFNSTNAWSISTDLHKYGYAPKGIAAILYRRKELANFQKFYTNSWPHGEYYTSGIQGSRSGAVVASAWSIIKHLGYSGFEALTNEVINIRKDYQSDLISFGCEILGEPKLSILSYQHPKFNMHSVWKELRLKNWNLSHLAEPDAIQMMFTPPNKDKREIFINDLRNILSRKI